MKARIILAVTEQVSEYDYERHFKTVEVDIQKTNDLTSQKAILLVENG